MIYDILLILINLQLSVIIVSSNEWLLKWSDHFNDTKLDTKLWRIIIQDYGLY
jgi:hypothetical protein